MSIRALIQPCRVLLLGVAIVLSPVAKAEETVAFNTRSHKYHCLTCPAALRCTVHCIKIPKSDAVKRGGVPCKVCGGSCR